MNKTITHIVACLLAGVISAPLSAAENYTIDSGHTWPMFEVNHLGFSTQRGRFNKTTGKITLDTDAKTGSVDLVIDATSIDMGFEKWDDHMRAADFFNVTLHPTIRFTSQKLVFEGDRVVAAEGNFTLLGTTRPLTLTVSNFRCAPHPMTRKKTCGADVSATIQRMQFGMAKYISMISNEVRISSPIEAIID